MFPSCSPNTKKKEVDKMTGKNGEQVLAQDLNAKGFWVKLIPNDARGAQPFDIIAVRQKLVLMLDSKVCGQKRFPMERVEDNQWLAFEKAAKRTCACIGLICWYNGKFYYIPYSQLRVNIGNASIPLAEDMNRLYEDLTKCV